MDRDVICCMDPHIPMGSRYTTYGHFTFHIEICNTLKIRVCIINGVLVCPTLHIH